MKNKLIIAAFIATGIFCFGHSRHTFAQNNSQIPQKKIEVVGSAEMEVVPDEIHFVISLREYMKDVKNKVTIDKLEKELQAAVNKAGIPKEDFQIENVYGYNWEWNKRKNEEFLTRKSFRLKLNDLNKINQIIAGVDQKGIEFVNINSYTHSKIEELKLELKSKALQAAREKASFLLSAIGEEAGNVLEITEIPDSYAYPMHDRMALQEMGSDSMQEVSFKKVKLNTK